MKKINKIAKTIKRVVSILAAVFGIVVYSTEYTGTESRIGWKDTLDKQIYFEHSILFVSVMIVLTIILISFLVQALTDYMIKLSNDTILKDNEINKLKEGHFVELNKISQEKQKEVDRLNDRLSKHVDDTYKKDSKFKIFSVMDDFMSNYGEIIAIQLYECKHFKENGDNKYEINPTNYYRTRVGQVANLIHERYTISEKMVQNYIHVRDEYKKGNDTIILNYIKTLTEQLVKKTKYQRVTEEIFNKYLLLTLVLQDYLDDLGYKIDSIDENFVQKISEYKRSGFMKGVLYGKYFKFLNTGNSCKGKRIYITRCLPIESREHMFVIIFEPNIIERKKYGDYLDKIGEQFYNTLSQKTNLVYNDIIGGVNNA